MNKILYLLVVIILFLLAYIYDLQNKNKQPQQTVEVTQETASTTKTTTAIQTNSEQSVPTTTPSTKPRATTKPSPIAKPSTEPAQKVTAPTPVVTTSAPTVGGCSIFPANNAWNTDISSFPVHPNSNNYIASIGANGRLHADFGGGGAYGIPFVVVPSNQTPVPITFTAYGDESDPGPYPIPADAPIEGGNSSGGDRHVVVLQQGVCKLYELYRAFKTASGWSGDSGAVYDLSSNALRPNYWTSADAAGLPILPGLVRYDEVAQGAVRHAVRFTASRTQKGFIHPATHFAPSQTNPNLPPMGLRLRLKADFDTSKFTGQSKVILEGFKKYGIILADNGSNWYITGASDPRWNDDDLRQLKTVPGSAFEAVFTGEIIK